MAAKWKRIAVAIRDTGARSSAALTKAGEIARRCNARLRMIHAYYPAPGLFDTFDPKTAEMIARESIARHRKGLERLARPLRRKGLDVATEVVWDYPPHEAIVRQVIRQKADLLVADLHRRGRLARWFLTNTDWELIRHCPCPLWLVKSSRLRPEFHAVAAIDPFHGTARPSRLDDRIVRTAIVVAKMFDGKIALCHARATPVLHGMPGVLARLTPPLWLPADEQRHARSVRKRLNQFAGRFAIPRAARYVETGDPVDVLLRLTRRLRADVLVMGAVSRAGLDRLLIGSTAERVIDDLTCDVIAVTSLPPGESKKTLSRRRRRPARLTRRHRAGPDARSA